MQYNNRLLFCNIYLTFPLLDYQYEYINETLWPHSFIHEIRRLDPVQVYGVMCHAARTRAETLVLAASI